MTDFEAATRSIEIARESFGRLDVLVNNAGFGDISSIEDTSLEEFRAQIDTNLFGVIHLTKAAVPLMREQGSGHIIQLSSIGGRIGPPGRGAYAAAKWGVEGFSEVLAKEVGPLGIKVTIVEPGAFRTDFVASSTIRPSRPEYASTVGVLADHVRSLHGTQAGNPARAASVILQIADLAEPPLRLLLGSDAVQAAEKSDQARIGSDRKWRELSLSTDFQAPSTSYTVPWERP